MSSKVISPAERSLFLLKTARFFTLASHSPDSIVWSATLNFVTAFEPLRIIWSSMRAARHSGQLRQCPQVAGSVFRTDLQGISKVGMDGAQFSGLAREIPDHECAAIHEYFYQQNFPNEAVRAQWMMPLSDFMGDGTHRFYEMNISEFWLLDIEGWLETKEDRKIAVPLATLHP